MFDTSRLIDWLGYAVVAPPALLFGTLGFGSLLKRGYGERKISDWVQAANVVGLIAALAILTIMLGGGSRHVVIELGDWVAIPHYHFHIKFLFDRLSIPLVILSFMLCGTIGAFASRYMHREPGFNRFFSLYSMFMLGMVATSLAGTIETLFVGWELVGLSSALLIAFFQERPAPSRNGLRVWTIYRISDAALLLAAAAMHHMTGEGDFDLLLGTEPWPFGVASVTVAQASLVGFLLLVAAAGKSALAPFSGWLPRAMEGPTPSSAVFYGALSVHLGAFLLLRVSPLLEISIWLSISVVAIGLITSVLAYVAGSAQTDVKSSLSYASLVQVGLIVAEIGLGFRYLVLVHLLGHACMRTLQFVRAPSLLRDYHSLENALGERRPEGSGPWNRLARSRFGAWLYRLAIERGYMDDALATYVVEPFLKFFRRCDAAERRWTEFLSGTAPRNPARASSEQAEKYL